MRVQLWAIVQPASKVATCGGARAMGIEQYHISQQGDAGVGSKCIGNVHSTLGAQPAFKVATCSRLCASPLPSWLLPAMGVDAPFVLGNGSFRNGVNTQGKQVREVNTLHHTWGSHLLQAYACLTPIAGVNILHQACMCSCQCAQMICHVGSAAITRVVWLPFIRNPKILLRNPARAPCTRHPPATAGGSWPPLPPD